MRLFPGNDYDHCTVLPARLSSSKSGKPLLLVFPFGLMSHYLRCLMLARHLKAGFTVLFLRHEHYGSFIEQEGFGTFECASDDAEVIMEYIQKFDFSWLNEKALEPVFANQVRIIEQLQPVAVLGDNCPTLKMAAEKTGVTYISLLNGYMSKYYAHTRALSQTHPAKALLAPLPETLVNMMTTAGESVEFYRVHKAFRQIRRQHGLQRKLYYPEELEGDWNLLCDLTELFPQKKLPAHYQVIAPLFYRSDGKVTGIAKQLDQSKKTIVVSMGSSGDWNKLVFLNDPYFAKFNIITAADKNKVLCAKHIISTSFINADEVFPYTNLVISHGGNGTIYQSLYYGIPVLCKTAHFEQEWNAGAVEKAGAGKSLDAISSLTDYISVIEAWISQKNTIQDSYKILIDRQAAALPEVIGMLTQHILAKVTYNETGLTG